MAHLAMTRKVGDMIRIGKELRVTVLRCRLSDVRLLFEAPPDVLIKLETPPSLTDNTLTSQGLGSASKDAAS